MPELAANSLPNTLTHTGGANSQEHSGTTPHIRALAIPFKKGQMISESDGSLLIKDVPMLAEGTWTDSAVGTPLNYTPKALSEYAGNWLDHSGWSRHLGGVPRDTTDKVGEAVNPHYGQFTGKDGKLHNGVISDVRVHPFTQKSRDTQEMIRHGLISFVSVEHGGDERYNPATRQMEANSLTFYGFAFVNKGACKLCRINEQPQAAAIEPAPEQVQDDFMDSKELETAIAGAVAPLVKELEALKAAQKPVEAPKVEIPKELTDAIGQIKELSERLEKIENAPTPTLTDAGVESRELAEPPRIVVKRGEIYQVN